MNVVCNKKDFCGEASLCGGAKPHMPDSECGKCPINKEAKCVPIEQKEQ